MIEKPDDEFWKRKLMAFLHDPPCKPLDFGPEHEKIAWQFCASENMTEDDKQVFDKIKDADWMASATDRMSFKQRECSNKFTGQANQTFKHPLSGDEYIIDKLPTRDRAEELLQNAVGGITGSWKQKFFLYWRRWMEEVTGIKDDKHISRHFPYFPAETRLPDHSIWNHMALSSALQGCRVNNKIKPAFLSFNLGPVQEFIAQARSTQDLWSGSYMLAWLTAHAMKVVADFNGPDSIIFPSLKGQGIFDVLYKNELYDKIQYGEDTLWERMFEDEKEIEKAKILLNPTLPNRFLAVLPEDKAEEIAQLAEKAIICELCKIGKKVFANLANTTENDKIRFFKQINLFPQISWQVMPWEHNIDKALAQFAELPINKEWNEKGLSPHDNLKKVIELSEKSGYKVDNTGTVWAANYAIAEYAMSARRNCREFDAFVTDENQFGSKKDELSGKEEVIGDSKYGAIYLIKHNWVNDYLLDKVGISPNIFKEVIRFDSVEKIANNNTDGSPYVAIIAMDGDEMGKWICGAKTPDLYKQICDNAKNFLTEEALKDIKRPISAAYHLQFSETLANFANHLAGKIVEQYKGQLIYAGGDDVLAMLPADKAIKCARALRAVFRGIKEELPDEINKFDIDIEQNGFVRCGKDYELMVPGPTADVSCGIAIGHKNHPLQHLVQEAQRAEKRAKNEYNRSAFAISLMKRGGEQINWGAKWDWKAIDLYDKYRKLRDKDIISARFPYALAGFLKPYKLEDEINDSMKDIILTELNHVMQQQGGINLKEECKEYLDELLNLENNKKEKNIKLDDFVKLFLTAAFIERERGE